MVASLRGVSGPAALNCQIALEVEQGHVIALNRNHNMAVNLVVATQKKLKRALLADWL